ncbi:MAG: hypothetical protein IKR86_04940 [Candidatus Methanomethylophilaceae archaeon]|nr:hypothetical protein [Candidatus Methanomethylophilaceae archaeon]
MSDTILRKGRTSSSSIFSSPAATRSSTRALTDPAPEDMDSTSSVLHTLPFSRTSIRIFIECFLSRTSSWI